MQIENSVFNVNTETKVDIHMIKEVISSSALRLALKFIQRAEECCWPQPLSHDQTSCAVQHL